MAKSTDKKKVKGPQVYRLYDTEGRTVDLVHPVDVREHLKTGRWDWTPPKSKEDIKKTSKSVTVKKQEEQDVEQEFLNIEEEEAPILPTVEDDVKDIKSKRVRR